MGNSCCSVDSLFESKNTMKNNIQKGSINRGGTIVEEKSFKDDFEAVYQEML